MNCQDIATLLDERDIGALSAAERGQAELHLASCRVCASEWKAHEQVLATAIPELPVRLARRCRELVAGAAPGDTRRRAGARPLLVGGLFFLGAAAAAVLSIDWSGESQLTPIAETALQTSDVSAPSSTPAPAEAPSSAASDDSQMVSGAVDASSPLAASAAADDGTFTVAVSPLDHKSTHPDVVAVTDALYAAMLDELRTVPNLELIELDSPIAVPEARVVTAGAVVAARTGARAVGLDGSPTQPELGYETLEVERTDAVAGTGLVLESGLNSGEDVEATHFVLSREAPTSAAAPAGGTAVFNAPLRGSAEGVSTQTVDGEAQIVAREIHVSPPPAGDVADPSFVNVVVHAPVGAGAPVASGSADPGEGGSDYDFVLNVAAMAGPDVSSGVPQAFLFNVTGSKGGGSNATVSFLMSGPVYESVDTAGMAKQVVEQLRKSLFVPDDVVLDELQSTILDRSSTLDARIEALAQLAMIATRSGLEGRTGPVVAAAVEMAASAATPGQRAEIWQLMRGSEDPGLVQPLADALLYDPNESVRIEAAMTLATFRDDPNARAALDYAAGFDRSAAVEMQAKWASLDAGGRHDFIVSSLLDTRLSDADRIEPLMFATRTGETRLGEPPAIASIEGGAATALIGILERSGDTDARVRLIPHLDAEAADVVAFLVDTLANDPAEAVRAVAAGTLAGRVDEPDVRRALELARTTDASPIVRIRAAGALGVPVGAP